MYTQQGIVDVIDLGGAWPRWPAGALKVWQEAHARAAAVADPSCWAPAEGDPVLREQLARVTGARADQLVVTSGVRAAAPALVRGCSHVVVERPTFLGVPDTLAAHGVPVRFLPWDRVREVPGGAALWVTTPCRNPDGRQPDAAFLADLRAAVRRGVRVICNTAYTWYAGRVELPPGVIRVGTLHKIAGPGAGVGWVVREDPGSVGPHSAMPAPPAYWQRVWGYFLEAGGLALLRAPHEEIEAVRAAFLGRVGTADAGWGPHVLLRVPAAEEDAVSALAEVGVIVGPGSAFGAEAPSVRACLIGSTVESARLAGERIRAVFPDLPDTPPGPPAPDPGGVDM
ncbi:pyridoxal phosphate-dependent aminotransferase [Streptomyces sp. NBC_00287]|uniref:pyridoxal phosphate-dependent aminotransferase n=1 Tax=Streptomyces sp. NBC_00287 TaxID=2975702 RepID=UPI002E2940CE|nr:pyridoxal phosphate-dependent aminotransferase [Streptomyces sp. NBC_00287]